MRKEDIQQKLSKAAFDFFYWFSRFEFALKVNSYLQDETIGAKAKPGWEKFIATHSGNFVVSDECRKIFATPPKQQFIVAHGKLEWRSTEQAERCQLGYTVDLIRIVRNNLFHGGKHGTDGWDDTEHSLKLLMLSKIILDQLAELANFNADYTRYY